MKSFSVSQFVELLNTALNEAVFPDGVLIEGEVAEYRVSQGKWIWFLLKDDDSTVSCFATVWQLRTPLEDGMQVRVSGRPKVHPRSGKFSVNVDRAEPVGAGALKRAFELLYRKLSEEGLFSPERKRALPRYPERIGLIASGESAAYTDFLRILNGRWGGVEVNHVHVAVQGKDAVAQIVEAFELFNERPELADVLVLTRGGGSMEDLQAFNSEEVARAVFSSRIPVIVGVGHERDETLADFAADVRASTPTNAAQLVVPDRAEIAAALDAAVLRVVSAMDGGLAERRSSVERSVRRLDAGISRATDSFSHRLRDLRESFASFERNVLRLRDDTVRLSGLATSAAGRWHDRLAADLRSKMRVLHGFDPEGVLRRGYAIVRKGSRIVRSPDDVATGDTLDIRVAKGSIAAEVTER